MPQLPNFEQENKLWSQGYLVAGVDEVGRGALAGPVVATAVILPPGIDSPWLSLVRDSKLLSPTRREYLYKPLQQEAIAVGIGIIPSEIIDSSSVLKATWLAMQTAVQNLPRSPDFLLVDGTAVPNLPIPQQKIIRGDKICLSIACASIIAKVTRDRIMAELHQVYPQYGLARHKGYGTKEHLTCLEHHGPSPIHRLSFAPVKELRKLANNNETKTTR